MARLPNDPKPIISPQEEDRRKQQETLQEVTERIRHKGEAFARVLRDHPDGPYVLLCLKQEFLRSFDANPYQNAYNTCAREMFEYIDQLIRNYEGKTHVAEASLLPASRG